MDFPHGCFAPLDFPHIVAYLRIVYQWGERPSGGNIHLDGGASLGETAKGEKATRELFMGEQSTNGGSDMGESPAIVLAMEVLCDSSLHQSEALSASGTHSQPTTAARRKLRLT